MITWQVQNFMFTKTWQIYKISNGHMAILGLFSKSFQLFKNVSTHLMPILDILYFINQAIFINFCTVHMACLEYSVF